MTTYLNSLAPDDVARRHRIINDAIAEQSVMLAGLMAQVDGNGRVPCEMFYMTPTTTDPTSTDLESE